jgi:hypothetical protein
MKLTGVGVVVIAALIAGCNSASSPGTNDRGGSTPGSGANPTDTPAIVATPALVSGFASIKLSGKGDKVATFTIPADAAAIATFTNRGDSNFTVESLAADGSSNDLLVNVIGSYSGTVLFDAQSGTHSVAFKIGSNGSWNATIKPTSAARPWDGKVKLAGKSDDVVLVNPPISGLSTATFTHNGSSNFAVTSYTADSPDLLINEIGVYTGQVQLPDGTRLLSISADGVWTATPG